MNGEHWLIMSPDTVAIGIVVVTDPEEPDGLRLTAQLASGSSTPSQR